MEYAAFICLGAVTAPYIGSMIGSTVILITFAIDLKNDLKMLDKNFSIEQNSIKLTTGICDIVKFHSSANQLSFYNESIQ